MKTVLIGSVSKEKYFIEFLNKEKGFKRDKKFFKTYKQAESWMKKNFEKYNTDMIQDL